MGVRRSKYRGTKYLIDVLRRDPCTYCGKRYKLPPEHKKAGKLHNTVDHIHPKAHGGNNTWMNYAAACPRCNTLKGDNSVLGHLLGVYIPCPDLETIRPDEVPETWYDPLGVLADPPVVDQRFVGLGARERKVLRAKLADA